MDRCIHGFDEQQCAACRRCQHGFLESRCAVCAPPRTARQAVLSLANAAPRPSEEHRGYEVFYALDNNSWYFRSDADAARSKLSFGSAFQARRAIDRLLDEPQPKPSKSRKR